jgi:transposase InsO family protein
VPASIADAMVELRKAHTRWTLALILQELVERRLWDETRPSRSTLYRFARNNNLMRDPHLASAEVARPFEFEKFGQMWIADFMHGPKLYEGKKKRKSYLHVIIDDCTRYVVSGRFYSSESIQSLILELMTAIRRHGIPHRLYTDNGSAYNSRHLKIVCANLSMQQPHTPPGRPQGRSKVERFFRTVRQQFLAKQRYKTFDEINAAFIEYVNDYHHRIHSTLTCSPMQKRLGSESVCQQVPEVADIESLFRLNRRCRIYNDGTIRLHKKAFEVPGCLPGGRVTIHYMPWNLSRIYYGDDLKLAIPVDLRANAHRFDNPGFTHTKEKTDDDE